LSAEDFAERFGELILAARARRTTRFDYIERTVSHLGIEVDDARAVP
jgi:hypothetical protein